MTPVRDDGGELRLFVGPALDDVGLTEDRVGFMGGRLPADGVGDSALIMLVQSESTGEIRPNPLPSGSSR